MRKVVRLYAEPHLSLTQSQLDTITSPEPGVEILDWLVNARLITYRVVNGLYFINPTAQSEIAFTMLKTIHDQEVQIIPGKTKEEQE